MICERKDLWGRRKNIESAQAKCTLSCILGQTEIDSEKTEIDSETLSRRRNLRAKVFV